MKETQQWHPAWQREFPKKESSATLKRPKHQASYFLDHPKISLYRARILFMPGPRVGIALYLRYP
jgi:hypothetical protein